MHARVSLCVCIFVYVRDRESESKREILWFPLGKRIMQQQLALKKKNFIVPEGEERRRFTGIRGHIPHGAFYFNMEPRLNTPSWPPGQNTLIKPWIKQKRKEEEEEWRKNGVWWRRVEKHPSSVLNS